MRKAGRPEVRKLLEVRKSRSPEVRKSRSPEVQKDGSPEVQSLPEVGREMGSPEVRKSRSPVITIRREKGKTRKLEGRMVAGARNGQSPRSNLFTTLKGGLGRGLHNSSVIPIKGCGLGDDDAGDATFNGGEGVLNLRLHASGDGAIGHKMVEFIAVDVADDAGVVVGIGQDAGLLEAVDEGEVLSAARALAVSEAMVSALVLSKWPIPSWVRGARTGVMPSCSSWARRGASTRSTSPTKP